MREQPVTPRGYLTDIFKTIWSHGGEVGLAAACVLIGVTVIAARSSLPFIGILFPVVTAALLLQAAAAGWRVWRRQGLMIATTRSLRDLDADDRADFERAVIARYRKRERGLDARYATRARRLTVDIAARQSGQAGPHRGGTPAVSKVELGRADDDGWPVVATPAEGQAT